MSWDGIFIALNITSDITLKDFLLTKKRMSSKEFSFIKIIFSSSMEFTGYATKGLQIHEFTKHYVFFLHL